MAWGYRSVYRPDHHLADATGRVLEHRLEAEKMLGRPLEPEEVVHHINGDKRDNRHENLVVLANQAEHARVHKTGERLDACRQGHPFTPENTVLLKSGARTCRICVREKHRAWKKRNHSR